MNKKFEASDLMRGQEAEAAPAQLPAEEFDRQVLETLNEKVKAMLAQFVGNEKVENITMRPKVLNRANLSLETLMEFPDAQGTYVLNEQTYNRDWEAHAKTDEVTLATLPKVAGRTLGDVIDVLASNHGSAQLLPGLEYLLWLKDHPEETPPRLRDMTQLYLFCGSAFMHPGSNEWCVPAAMWSATSKSWKLEPLILDRGIKQGNLQLVSILPRRP